VTATLWQRLGVLLAELGETGDALSCYGAALSVRRRAVSRGRAGKDDLSLPDLALLGDALGR
jgi:hypothetical protein